jgi:pyruvate/2-oxoglutarate dehydrogenase complex dihydrolipoamide dehydrogenase (E3) component
VIVLAVMHPPGISRTACGRQRPADTNAFDEHRSALKGPMAEPERYDAIILGAGQGGVPLARALAEAGRRTLLVEATHVGGTCINEGCTPTKTMVASARVAYLARRAADYGVGTGAITVDMRRVRQRKRDIVESFRGGSERRLRETANLTLLMASARFTGPRQIEARTLDGSLRGFGADLIVINTGGRPALPAIDGIDDVPWLDSTTIMELDVVPEHLLVVGGGYIGLEFGQMMRRFGSRVTIVQRAPVLLPREDGDICGAMAEIMRQDGLDLRLGATVSSLRPAAGGGALATLSTDGAALAVSHVLVAAGRVPNTEALDCGSAGVALAPGGFVQVNERLETSAPDIYAIGDVKGGPAFTHISYDDFRILRTNLLENGSATTRDRLVPYTLFTDPQLGRIGLTEDEARRRGLAVDVYVMPMSHVARALEVDEPRGLMKAIVDRASGRILGAAVLGIEGGEIMGIFEVAMMGGVTFDRLREATFAHPTTAEALNNLFATAPREAGR